MGNGPVDALFGAVDSAVEPVIGWYPKLTEYEIRAVSEGEDAQGAVMVRARRSTDPEETAETVNGQSVDIKVMDGKVMIDGAEVISADIETTNGVIHVINKVILPEM